MSKYLEKRQKIKFGDEQPNDYITGIVFASCGNSVTCKLIDEDNIGQWWGIFAPRLPDRYVCLKSREALKHFTQEYGYLDKNECVNYKSGYYVIGQMCGEKKPVIDSLKKIYKFGIPQKTTNSGLCWYSAMCFAAFYCKHLRNIFISHSTDEKLNALMHTCLTNKINAEVLRCHLYDKYKVGDDPKQSPDKDGQNGLSQLLILVAQLQIPFVCLIAPNLSDFKIDIIGQDRVKIPLNNKDVPEILCVRCYRTKWKPQMIIKYGGHKYKLTSILIGSEECGHQIGVSSCDAYLSRWAVCDSDACKKGIGPMYWKIKTIEGESISGFTTRWWTAFSTMIPVTMYNFGSFCNFSIHNPASCSLDAKMNGKQCDNHNAGVVNCDFIYILIKRAENN